MCRPIYVNLEDVAVLFGDSATSSRLVLGFVANTPGKSSAFGLLLNLGLSDLEHLRRSSPAANPGVKLLLRRLGSLKVAKRSFCERALARRFRPDGGRPEKSRRERLHSCGVSERQCLSAASSAAQPQRGRPRRKSFSPRLWAFWFFSAREKNRRPAMEACSGSMLRSGASCFVKNAANIPNLVYINND